MTAGSIFVPAACSDSSDTQGATCAPTLNTALFPQSVASGDPRPDSVILWTRIADKDATGDLSLTLEVALDEGFQRLVELDGQPRQLLTATEAFDWCVKVKVKNLSPATTYYYRFFYVRKDGCYASRVGRTRTAPAPEADVKVRFAFVSCQDYVGRYYNAYLAMAKEELDFFVHLGDYIYETTGDPTFQSTGDQRKVVFTDQQGALALKSGDGKPYFAAKSLSNYRDLYKTYRSDPALQAVHERFPMVATWDDHEFSDDCHGATATYFDGKQNETDVARRKAANQAWFEYMPVDYPAGDDFVYDPKAEYPKDITIYRDYHFGKHLHLVMTDLRTYRADHVIPEEAFPGAVIMTQDVLTAMDGSLPMYASPYLDVGTYKDGLYQNTLQMAAPKLGYDPKQVTGLLSARFVNQVVAQINQTQTPPVPLLSDVEMSALDRGFAYIDLGKGGFYTSIGSRYFVIKDVFDVVSKYKYDMSSGASEVVMGDAQEKWFLDTMTQSKSTWKVWGNEYCLSQLAIDLRTIASLPEPFQRRFYMDCDDWDGFRNRRNALLAKLADLGNVVAITGDIHAFFAGTPMTEAGDKQIVEFIGSSITSNVFKSELVSQVSSDPVLGKISGAALLAAAIDTFLTNTTSKVNPHLGFANSQDNGFCVAEVSETEIVVTMHQIPSSEVSKDYSGKPDALMSLVKVSTFKTVAGAHDLYRKDDKGAWQKWDSKNLQWT